jgi:hypothetical protein
METGREVAISYTISEDVAPRMHPWILAMGTHSRVTSQPCMALLRSRERARLNGKSGSIHGFDASREPWLTLCPEQRVGVSFAHGAGGADRANVWRGGRADYL